jgi:hypothetical protein
LQVVVEGDSPMAATRRKPKGTPQNIHDSPILWFALLERARSTADPELYARAEQELARQGIRVVYGPWFATTGFWGFDQRVVTRLADAVADRLRPAAGG